MRFALLAIAACSSAPPVPSAPPVAPSPDAAAPVAQALDAPVSSDAPDAAPVACVRSDQRMRGSACCTSAMRGERDKFPGMTFVSCTGPRIGLPCRAKGDCDIGCSCDRSDHLSPGNGPQGPADGTRGVVGHCASSLQIGVWMCQLDETGKVTHLIID